MKKLSIMIVFSQYNRFFFYLLNGLFTYFASVDIVDTEIKNTDIV